MNFFIRALIAVIIVIGIRYALPAVLRLIGFPASADFETVITGVTFVVALLYIIWGRPVPNPFA
jgi:hypothetical protein